MSSEKDKEFIARWSQKRRDGRWRYAIHDGLLLFSWPIYFLSELLKYLLRDSGYDFSWTTLLSGCIVWTILGLVAFGVIMWIANEKRYQEITKKESD